MLSVTLWMDEFSLSPVLSLSSLDRLISPLLSWEEKINHYLCKQKSVTISFNLQFCINIFYIFSPLSSSSILTPIQSLDTSAPGNTIAFLRSCPQHLMLFNFIPKLIIIHQTTFLFNCILLKLPGTAYSAASEPWYELMSLDLLSCSLPEMTFPTSFLDVPVLPTSCPWRDRCKSNCLWSCIWSANL